MSQAFTSPLPKKEKRLNNLFDRIEEGSGEIDHLVADTAATKERCEKLTQEIGVVSSALKHSLEMATRQCDSLKDENDRLSEEIEEQNTLCDQIEVIWYLVNAVGTDFNKYPAVDEKTLRALFPDIVSKNLPADLVEIVKTDPFFDGCTTDEEFYERCKNLMKNLGNAREGKTMVDTLELDLETLRAQYAEQTSTLTREEQKLIERRDRLKKQLRELQATEHMANHQN